VERERAVDVQTGRALGRVALDAVGGTGERGAQVVEPLARLRADGDDVRLWDELARLRQSELERLRIDRVRLRHGDDSPLDPQQSEDREVLVRLRPGALAGVDDEQEQIDAGRACDHRADEALMARHVDDGEAASVGQLERRIAEVDRDPASPLLGQAVGVLAGQRPNEPRLAVVDVARRPDRERHQSRLTMSRHGLCSQRSCSSSSATNPRAS
jgi:hypothetical protein